MGAIDFHVHAFPDTLASRALSRIHAMSGVKSVFDGTLRALEASMDSAGVHKSVILSIATKPEQFDSILRWSRSIASDRIVPFLSVHPSDPSAAEKIRITREEGFKGLKVQPYYQDVDLDGEAMFPIYEAMEKHGLICLAHTGFDVAYPRTRKADPPRIVNILHRFPALTFVASHLGAWQDWEMVREWLPGERLFVDISFSLEYLPPQKAKELILSFPPERVLFGSDSPWADPAHSLALLRKLRLERALEHRIISENARALLGG